MWLDIWIPCTLIFITSTIITTNITTTYLAAVEFLLRHMSVADMSHARKRNSLLVEYMYNSFVMPRSCIRCGDSGEQ